jgi:hypothetical protein
MYAVLVSIAFVVIVLCSCYSTQITYSVITPITVDVIDLIWVGVYTVIQGIAYAMCLYLPPTYTHHQIAGLVFTGYFKPPITPLYLTGSPIVGSGSAVERPRSVIVSIPLA